MLTRLLVFVTLLVCAAGAQTDPECRSALGDFAASLNAGWLDDVRGGLMHALNNDSCFGTTLVALAALERRAGNFQDAEHYAFRAVRLLEPGGGNEVLLASALRTLALTYVERGLPAKALPIIERLGAMTILKVSDRASLRGLLAAALHSSGDARGAEREYLTAIRMWESCCEATRSVPELSNLGLLYLNSGRLGEAAAVLLRALSALAVSTTDNDDQKIDVLNNLAVVRARQGELRVAQKYAQQAIDLLENRGPEKHRQAAEVYRNCAAVFRTVHRRKEAKVLEARARAIQRLPRATVDVSELNGFTGLHK